MDSTNATNEKKTKQTKSKVDIGNIKSDYFLQRVFTCFKKVKFLEIIKYNKKLQKRLNLNFQDYKDQCQLYTPIDIEIKVYNAANSRFINIPEENKKYFHIYFDNSNEEIERNYLKQNEKVEIIKIRIDPQITSFNKLFDDCTIAYSIYFKKFYRINITDMSVMFYKCESLKEINFSNFITDNVTNMSGMFYKCESLKELNLSNFNTSNVTNMSGMFLGCDSLKELNLSNFNTSNVTYMNSMFYECKSLKKVNLSSFNTINVTNMYAMFWKCKSLEELDLSNFNTNNAPDMGDMFYQCISLKELNISNFNFNNVNIKGMYGMFFACSNELKDKVRAQHKNLNI